MTDTHTTAHIPDEAVQAAINKWHDKEYENIPEFDNMRNSITAALPYLSAPCAVEVDKLHWDGLVGFVGSFSYVVAPPSFTKGWRVWGKLSDKSASVGGVLITTTATDEEEAKAAAQADFERRILSCVVTKPVDVAAVREVPVNIDKLIAELKSAEDMCFSWSGSALLANELNAADTDEGHISLYKDLCGLGNAMSYLQSEVRAISAEPAQGDQWRTTESAPKDGTIIDLWANPSGCAKDRYAEFFWDGERWCKSGLELFTIENQDALYWMPLPATPNAEAGK